MWSTSSRSTVVAPRRARTAADTAGQASRRPTRLRIPEPAPRSSVRSRHAPGSSRRSAIGPMRVRTSRRTGWPTASHMRRTWRLRPSWIVMRSRFGGDERDLGRRGHAVVELDALAQLAQPPPQTGGPRPRPGTPSRRRSDGWVRRCARSPSLVSRSRPSVSGRAGRPGTRAARSGTRSVTIWRPCGSAAS